MQTGSDGDSRLKNPTLLLLPLLTLMLQIKQLLQGPFSLVSKLFVFFYYLEKPKLLLLFFGLICFFILSTDSASQKAPKPCRISPRWSFKRFKITFEVGGTRFSYKWKRSNTLTTLFLCLKLPTPHMILLALLKFLAVDISCTSYFHDLNFGTNYK